MGNKRLCRSRPIARFRSIRAVSEFNGISLRRCTPRALSHRCIENASRANGKSRPESRRTIEFLFHLHPPIRSRTLSSFTSPIISWPVRFFPLHFICHRNILELKQTADMPNAQFSFLQRANPMTIALNRIAAKNVGIAISFFFIDVRIIFVSRKLII